LHLLQVEKVAKKLALVPEHGGPMWTYLLSYVQSTLMVQNKLIPRVEAQKPTDINTAISTFDILQKAR
jgi:hypothetical protein